MCHRVHIWSANEAARIPLEKYEYDSYHNMVSYIDANENETRYTYDHIDRLINKSYADNSEINISYENKSFIFPLAGLDHSISVTDENGNETIYYLDSGDRILVAETVPCVFESNQSNEIYSYISNEYDALGNKTKETDARGNSTLYEYDMLNRLKKKTDALGNITNYRYNGLNKISYRMEPEGVIIQYEYDAAGRLDTAKTGFYSEQPYYYHYSSYAYDNCYNITGYISGVYANGVNTNDCEVTYSYGYDNRIESKNEKISDGVYRITTYEYDFNGNITEEKTKSVDDENYIKKEYIYDNQNRKTQQHISACYESSLCGEQVIDYIYDNMDHVTEMREHKNAGGNSYLITFYEYDSRYRLTEKTEPSGVVTEYEYDDIGNITKQTVSAGEKSLVTENDYELDMLISTTNALNNTTRYKYDENGNKIMTVDARYSEQNVDTAPSVRQEYDALNRPTRKLLYQNNSYSVTEVREYDGRGNLVKVMDGEDYAEDQIGTCMTYDFADNITSVASPEAVIAGKISKEIIYNSLHKPTRETLYRNSSDTGESTVYEYYLTGEIKKVTDPYSNYEQHEYDATGELFEKITDKNSGVTRIYKSLFGIPYRTEYPDGTTETIDYDWFLGLAIAVVDRKGRRRSYKYNSAKQVTEEEFIYETDSGTGDQNIKTTYYDYDDFGNLIEKRYKHSNVTPGLNTSVDFEWTEVLYEYDDLQRVSKEEKGDGSITMYTYDAASNIIGERRKVTANNYDIIGYDYDDFGRKTEEFIIVDNEFMSDEYTGIETDIVTLYTYDKSGRVKTKRDSAGNITSYKYNAAGNLIQEISPSGAITSYTYDFMGDLIQKTNPIGGYEKYEYDALSRVITKKTNAVNETNGELTWHYGYDAEGNLISEKTPSMTNAGENKKLTYTYDCMNRMIASYNAEGELLSAYKYDNADNIIKSVDGLHAAYADEIDTASGNTYIYDAFDRVISQSDAAENTISFAYTAYDKLSEQTDARGNKTRYSYDNNTLRLSEITYPNNKNIAYTYDYKGRVLTVTTTAQNFLQNRTERYTYTPFDLVYTYEDAAGNITKTLYDSCKRIASVTDALGNSTHYSYNADGLLSQKTTPITETANAVENYTYDGAGNLTSTELVGDTASESRITYYTYLSGGELSSVSNNAGSLTQYSYDAGGNISEEKILRNIDGGYDITSYNYDIYDRPVTVSKYITLSKTNTSPAITRYTYNIMGMKTSETTPKAENSQYSAQYTTSYTYDTLGRLSAVGRMYNGNAVSTQYSYDAAGNVTQLRDEAGNTTSYTYDSMNNPTSVTDAAGVSVSYEYDAAGNLTKEIRPNGTWLYEYDSMDRLTTTKAPDGNIIQKVIYDANGNVVKTIDAKGYASGLTDNARYGTIYTYNKSNMITSITTPEGHTTTYDYTPQGDIKSVTDGCGSVTSYSYDAAGNVLSVTNALGEATEYTYDAAGNRTSMTDGAGRKTNYSYGSFGLLLSVTDALERETKYEYDTEGNITKIIDKGGIAAEYGYDNRGNLTSKTAGVQNVSYTYDTMGNRTSMTDSTGAYTYTYDALGRLTSKSKNGSVQISYAYDNAGNMTQQAYGGISVNYTYDSQNRLTAVSGGGTSASYSYDNAGNMVSASYGGGAASETRTYNRDGAITEIRNTASGAAAVYQYSYDNAGRVASKTDPYGTTSYTYDAAGRLSGVQMPGAAVTYTYDGAGNRTSATHTSTSAKVYHDLQSGEDFAYNKAVTNYTYNAANELENTEKVLYNEDIARVAENTTYSYDERGNMYSSVVSVMRNASTVGAITLSGTANTLVTMTVNEYDSFNQLTKTSVTRAGQTSEVSYTYDGDGIRASRSVVSNANTTTTSYITSDGAVLADSTAKYIRGMGYAAKIGAANDVHYYQYNAHGDVVQVVSNSGNVENSYDYDAFGEAILEVETISNEIRYSGEFYDAAAGLYYLRARYYDPVTARFTQEDTYRGDAMDVSSLNLYAYCGNDPINFADPSGHGKVWNNYGEVIGVTDGADYVDRSDAATSIHGGGEQAKQPIYATDSGRDKTVMYSASSGYATLVYTDEVSNYSGSGWYEANDRIAVYSPVTGAQSEAYAVEILQKRKGDATGIWVTANERVIVYDSETGNQSQCEAWELWGKRAGDNTGKWLTANETVVVYDSVTGQKSQCEAWELYGKRVGDGTGKWLTAHEKVAVFDSVTGKQSQCEAWEIEGKRSGDGTGKWYTANEKVTVYEAYTGKKSECEAWEIEGKRAGDRTGVWRTGSEKVAVYEYGSGHKSYCRYDEIERKRSGDSTGRWGLAGDAIPVYSLMNGKTVYVRGDQAQQYLQNDNILYRQKQIANQKYITQIKTNNNSQNLQSSNNIQWDHSKDFIKGIYYTSYMLTPYDLERMKYKDDIILERGIILRATSQAAAEELKAMEQIELEISMDVAMMSGGLKADSKMVRSAIKSVGGMTNRQAEMFQREIESLKHYVGKKNNDNFIWKTLVEIANEIKSMYK